MTETSVRIKIKRERLPELRFCAQAGDNVFKLRRQNTDDCIGHIVQDERFSDYIRVAIEALLPEFMAQDHDAILALLLFLRDKEAAHCWLNTQNGEEAGGDEHRLQT